MRLVSPLKGLNYSYAWVIEGGGEHVKRIMRMAEGRQRSGSKSHNSLIWTSPL